MKKKVLSALLCAAMVLSMTACGLKEPETTDAGNDAATTDEAPATEAAEGDDASGTEPVGPAVTLVFAEVNPLDTIVGKTDVAFKEK